MKTVINFTCASLMALILAGCAGRGGVEMVQRSDQDIARLMSVNDNLIVPGDRVGPVFLGMTEGQLYKKMGNPNRVDRMDNGATIAYQWAGFTVLVQSSTHKVFRVDVAGSSYSTAEGVSIGTSELEMKSKLGQPAWGVLQFYELTVYKFCFNSGLIVLADKGRVTGINLVPADCH